MRRISELGFHITAALAIYLAGDGNLGGQVLTILHSFKTNEAVYPNGGLVASGNHLYGVAQQGGDYGNGSVFTIQTDGSGFTILHSFSCLDYIASTDTYTNFDGGNPDSAIVLLGGILYGTTSSRGYWGQGTIFAVNIDGTGFTNLHNFAALSGGPYSGTNFDGAEPYAGLISDGQTLYGTASVGGYGNGTVFAIQTDGNGYDTLHYFSPDYYNPANASYTNFDGAFPSAGLAFSNGLLYGTAATGGNFGRGTLFSIQEDGSSFTTLYNFTNSGVISAGVIFSGNSFYGIIPPEFGFVSGTPASIYKVNADGTDFITLHSFSFYDGTPPCGLTLAGDAFYGTASGGGYYNTGTIFSLKTDGSGFTVLYNFTDGDGDATGPTGVLTPQGYRFFGTSGGGAFGNGTIFSLSFEPQLNFSLSATNVILSWPTNVAGFDYTGFTLQSSTNVPSTNWITVTPPPVVVNGLLTVTNAMTGAQMFYRLRE